MLKLSTFKKKMKKNQNYVMFVKEEIRNKYMRNLSLNSAIWETY